MTTHEFDAPASSPRRGEAVAYHGSSSGQALCTAILPKQLHATIADVTDEEHQSTPGMARPEDFNPYVVVQFLRDNGIDVWVGESDGFGFVGDGPDRASNVLFACVCLRVHQLCTRSGVLVRGGEAMIARGSRRPPVETLSARVLRYRIARGYNITDLASAAGVYGGSIRRLESGRTVDKRIFGALAAALGVPLCRLVCGEHSCAQRACVSGSRLGDASEPPRRRWRALFARFLGMLGGRWG